MKATSPAIEWVRMVAEQLGPLRSEVVFLGGATVELLLTDPAAAMARPTKDVDVIVEISSLVDYARFSQRLREQGFAEDTEEGAPLCRWVVQGIKVDVMPTSAAVLGFSNRWYGPAMKAAELHPITDELSIRLVTAPCFAATKLEAFHGRGEGDYQLSHDLEDVIALIDGRPFQDLAREAEVKDIVTRAISGHATEQMQRHYSTVNAKEVEESIGRVISLARARELLEAREAMKRVGGADGGAEALKTKKTATQA